MVLPQGSFVFCERRRIIDICKDEDDVTIVNADAILEGYQVYLVEQWVTDRKREIDTAVSFTGDPFHKIRAVAIRIDKPGVQCKRLEEIFEMLYVDGAKRKPTSFGDVFVTNLSLFTSSLNIVHVPDGDFDLYKNRFYLNLNLRRMGCSGRSALTLKSPSDAQREKFNQLYKISDSTEFEETVIRLVVIVQNCLYIFGLFSPQWIDGLLCTSTEYALDEFYDRFLFDQFQRPVVRETKLDPNVLAGLLSKLSSIRGKLQHLANNVSKDPFAEPEAFINSIKAYQVKNSKQLNVSGILDQKTILSIQTAYQTSFNPQGLKVHKVLKSKIEDFSGMPSVNTEGETTDLEVFTKHIHSESLKMLWRGKPKHKPDVADALASGDWLTGGKELGKSLVRGLAKTTRETKSKSQAAIKNTISGDKSNTSKNRQSVAFNKGNLWDQANMTDDTIIGPQQQPDYNSPKSDDERGGGERERDRVATTQFFGARVASFLGAGDDTDEGAASHGHATVTVGDTKGSTRPSAPALMEKMAGSQGLSDDEDMATTAVAGSTTTIATGIPTFVTASATGGGVNALNGLTGGIFGQLQRQQHQEQQLQQQQQPQSGSGSMDSVNFEMSLQACMAQSPCLPAQPELVYFHLTPYRRRPLAPTSSMAMTAATSPSTSTTRLARAGRPMLRTKSMSDLQQQERVLGCRAVAARNMGEIPGIRVWPGPKRSQLLSHTVASRGADEGPVIETLSKNHCLRKRSHSTSIGLEKRAKGERYRRGFDLWGNSIVSPFDPQQADDKLQQRQRGREGACKGGLCFGRNEHEPLTRLEVESDLHSYYLHQALREKEDQLRSLCKRMDAFEKELASKLDPLQTILNERTREFAEVEQEAHKLLIERRELLEEVQAKEHATQRSIYHLESMVGKLIEMRDFTGAFFTKIDYLDTKLPVSQRRLAIWVDRLQALQYHWLRTIGRYMTPYAPPTIRNRFTEWEHNVQLATIRARELRGEYGGPHEMSAVNTAAAVAAAIAGLPARANQQQFPYQQQPYVPPDASSVSTIPQGVASASTDGGRDADTEVPPTVTPNVIEAILASMGIFVPPTPPPSDRNRHRNKGHTDSDGDSSSTSALSPASEMVTHQVPPVNPLSSGADGAPSSSIMGSSSIGQRTLSATSLLLSKVTQHINQATSSSLSSTPSPKSDSPVTK